MTKWRRFGSDESIQVDAPLYEINKISMATVIENKKLNLGTEAASDTARKPNAAVWGRLLLLATTISLSAAPECIAAPARPNILLICVDDLRPELGCYGSPQVLSPHIDRLAARGARFDRAFVQVAQCGPSRINLLTGLRPDTTGIYTLSGPRFDRRNHPSVTTLGEHFKRNGYHTQAIGKVFHNGHDDPKSWSVPTFENDGRNFMFLYADEGKLGAIRAAGRIDLRPEDVPTLSGYKITASQAPDVDDRVLGDGIIADRAIAELRKSKDRPFLLAVGFYRPHLPFVAPKRYFDLYPANAVQLPPGRRPPRDAPVFGWFNASRYFDAKWRQEHSETSERIFGGGPPLVPNNPGHAILSASCELRSYDDIALFGEIEEQRLRDMRHAYYACVSYVDAQVGRILAELESLKLAENTIVVLWGDHGFHLGEKGLWGKLTNYETDTRIPLIIAVPGMNPSVIPALVETVDVFPTLAELCGLPEPQHVEGTSMVPLFSEPERPWKSAVFSQYPRGNEVMGKAIRTERFRYVEWERNEGGIAARELYDLQSDPDESINVAAQPSYANTIEELHRKLEAGWQSARPPNL